MILRMLHLIVLLYQHYCN